MISVMPESLSTLMSSPNVLYGIQMNITRLVIPSTRTIVNSGWATSDLNVERATGREFRHGRALK